MKKYRVLLCGLFLFGIADAQYTVLHNFTDTNGFPGGDLTLVGEKLYGMTGAFIAPYGPYHGSIFSMDTDGTHYKVLHAFDSINAGFAASWLGSLTYSNGVLFGMTPQGGKDSVGNIFAIDTDGSNYRELFYFDNSDGAYPAGSLTISGKKLYGMTNSGGPSNDTYGCIFFIDSNGSGFKILHYFGGIYGLGSKPYGSLILSGRKLYGMTSEAGMNGNIFSIDTDGNEYKTLHEFDMSDGGKPYGSLLLSKGVLYGMSSGELLPQPNQGNIFSIDTGGSNYRTMGGLGVPGGRGTFILSGSVLYGMIETNIFSIDTDGNGFTTMFDYTNSIYGVSPCDALTLSGNVLYGMTSQGGINNYGVIFKIDTNAIAGINNLSINKEAIRVYPNPSNGVFNLVIASVVKQSTVEIYNVLGENIYKSKINSDNTEINLNKQPQGVYLYRVISESGELIGEGKVVIQR